MHISSSLMQTSRQLNVINLQQSATRYVNHLYQKDENSLIKILELIKRKDFVKINTFFPPQKLCSVEGRAILTRVIHNKLEDVKQTSLQQVNKVISTFYSMKTTFFKLNKASLKESLDSLRFALEMSIKYDFKQEKQDLICLRNIIGKGFSDQLLSDLGGSLNESSVKTVRSYREKLQDWQDIYRAFLLNKLDGDHLLDSVFNKIIRTYNDSRSPEKDDIFNKYKYVVMALLDQGHFTPDERIQLIQDYSMHDITTWTHEWQIPLR